MLFIYAISFYTYISCELRLDIVDIEQIFIEKHLSIAILTFATPSSLHNSKYLSYL